MFILSSSLGQARRQWTLWLPTLATPQVFHIMPTLSEVQQHQQLASRNATNSSGTRLRGLWFFAFALESYDYLATQALIYNRHIALASASTGALTYGSSVASVHRKISVAVVKGNHGIFWVRVQLCTRVSGHARVPGHRVPMAEIK
jgi:hypothetical protein